MKVACILESIKENIATLYDYYNRKEYTVRLSEQEVVIYQDMINEAKAHEINEETVDPIVFYNIESGKLITTDDEEDIKLFG